MGFELIDEFYLDSLDLVVAKFEHKGDCLDEDIKRIETLDDMLSIEIEKKISK